VQFPEQCTRQVHPAKIQSLEQVSSILASAGAPGARFCT
jgi:hypothetical protein